LVAHRGDLQAGLLETAHAMPAIELLTGACVKGVTAGARGITADVTIADRTETIRADLLVGADGVRSTVRRLVNAAESRFSGELAWRATITADSDAGSAFSRIAGPDCVTAFLHRGFHLVAYPMQAGKAFNLVAF